MDNSIKNSVKILEILDIEFCCFLVLMCFDLVFASAALPPTHLSNAALSLSIRHDSHAVPKHTAVASDGGMEMDEESPLIVNLDKRGVPSSSSDMHSNEDSELSSPPPDDGSSGGEQVYVDERSMHPPPPPYVLSPANMVPVVEHGGFISPGAPPPVLVMTAIQSEGFSSDRELNETPLQGAELRKQLITQLEYYFSKENLSSDKYLCKLVAMCVQSERKREDGREGGRERERGKEGEGEREGGRERERENVCMT